MDNGPELIAQEFIDWCGQRSIELRYAQPEKPDQNAYIELINRSYQEEVLDTYLFEDLDPVRALSAEWLRIYNKDSPHDALDSIPPAAFQEKLEAAATSTFNLST